MTMSMIDARLAELGIDLPGVVPPVAVYVPAIVSGNLVFTSGQLPMVSGALPATGKVGDGHGLVPAEDARAYARQSALNGLAAIKAVIGSLDRITQVVKVTGFVASDPSFTGQPGVINGASEVLGEIFGDRGIHARSAVGVAVLPLDSPVEVEFVVSFA
jgi:enamine deaminase RidA (YjgF/YER057c/UK114 family)